MLKTIRESEIVELLKKLIKIPSVSGEEGEIAEFLASYLRKIGMDVGLQEVGSSRSNVIAKIKGKEEGKTILFQGHMDTVPPYEMEFDPFAAQVKDGRVLGRGACDMKGGIAAIVMAANAVQESGIELEGDLILAFTVGEESDKKGIYYLAKSGLTADVGVSCEPSNLAIAIGTKGSVSFKITTKGKSVHGSMPEKGVNAIYKMCKLVHSIEELKPAYYQIPGFGKIKGAVNINFIEGGHWKNVVPSSCTIGARRTIVPPETKEKAVKEFQRIIKRLKEKDSQFDAELIVWRPDLTFSPIVKRGLNPTVLNLDEPILKVLTEAYKHILGASPKMCFEEGWSELDFLINDMKIPTAIFGPGRVQEAHSSREYVEVDQLVKATKVYARFIEICFA